jgi:hypothetical protein
MLSVAQNSLDDDEQFVVASSLAVEPAVRRRGQSDVSIRTLRSRPRTACGAPSSRERDVAMG